MTRRHFLYRANSTCQWTSPVQWVYWVKFVLRVFCSCSEYSMYLCVSGVCGWKACLSLPTHNFSGSFMYPSFSCRMACIHCMCVFFSMCVCVFLAHLNLAIFDNKLLQNITRGCSMRHVRRLWNHCLQVGRSQVTSSPSMHLLWYSTLNDSSKCTMEGWQSHMLVGVTTKSLSRLWNIFTSIMIHTWQSFKRFAAVM